jgi:hypothetical protein
VRKRISNKLIRDEKGQALVLVLVLILLGSLIITPMLSHIGTGLKVGKEVYEERMELFYAADSGIEDALWQIKYEKLTDDLFDEDYDPYDYSEEYNYREPLVVNDKEVNVTIENIWVPDIDAPDADDAALIIEGIPPDIPPKLIITGSIPDESTYQIKIIYNYDNDEDPGGGTLAVETIGIWLPPGFHYAGNCSLATDSDTAGDSDPVFPYPCPYKSGEAVVWDFEGAVSLINFPGDTGPPMVRSFTFQFTSDQPDRSPGVALSWIDTTGLEDYGIDYTWDADTKVYKIVSTATDDTFDPPKQTIVDAYTARSEMRLMGQAVGGDYRAIGNSLMIDANHDGYYRETLLSSSDATVNDMPADANVELAYLYWSGWFEEGVTTPLWGVEDCNDFVEPIMDWSYGSRWTIYPPSGSGNKEFRGQGTTSSTVGPRTLPMGDSLDLSEYVGVEVRVSWNQREEGDLSSSDALYYAFSGDGGDNWSTNYRAFRDDNPPSTFSAAVPDQYLIDGEFKMRFYFTFNRDSEYVYLDNIKITAVLLEADTSAIFKINGTQVYFAADADGNLTVPTAGAQPIIADPNNQKDRVQAMLNESGPDYSYSCRKDVTDLVRAFSNGADLSATPPVYGNGNATQSGGYTVGDVDATWDAHDEWAYAGWSLVIIYSSSKTRGHQLYLYDDFRYSYMDRNVDWDGDGSPGGTIGGFLVPEPVPGEVNAAKLTVFVGEGDDVYNGDYLAFNGTKLWDGTTSHSLNDVWNSKSMGMSADGVDVDTLGIDPTHQPDPYYITWDSDLLEPGDTSAQIDMYTQTDSWNLIYIILSFRSSITSGGTISYLVRG